MFAFCIISVLPGSHIVAFVIGFRKTSADGDINSIAGAITMLIAILACLIILAPDSGGMGAGALWFLILSVCTAGLVPFMTIMSAFGTGKFFKVAFSSPTPQPEVYPSFPP